MTKHEALERYFGHTQFRPSQDTVIDTLLSGRDVLGVMPTGAGKSVCFQIPALLLPGFTIVVSPLISLMKDQVAGLREGNIPVAFINSSLTSKQYKEVLRRVGIGLYKIIYVAPERLNTADFLRFAQETPISLIAVDEAHCVSQWGQDFRPSYLKIADFTEKLNKRPVIGAFTATATADVKNDIIKLLKLSDPVQLTTGFDRPNLYFGVEKPKNKGQRFYELIAERSGLCGIVYCSTRKTTDRVCSELRRRGIPAARYHAGLEDTERRENQDDFIQGKISVIVATNAFGMGIDKPDVRYVIHYNMPKNLENYYQEAGRAGRDGNPSECIMLFSEDDIRTSEYFIDKSGESGEINKKQGEKERRKIYNQDVKRLDSIIKYCEITSCLRSYILSYFGEKQNIKCNNCSNCLKPGLWKRLFSNIIEA
ncbi:MAG: RecQ family ATP-dependent DNA helicase [Oscillospiraceae bacterium]|nr:RecQ family ATP-dependent DNA helicase [Oscillospiraceae bacterium]